MNLRQLLPLVLLTGCALQDGEGFALLQPSVRAEYTFPAARDAGGGYQRLSSDYQVRLSTARMRLEAISLLGSTSGSGPSSFDPANPPPGYSICHNGHCDRDDGAEVSYEEVAAELAGGGATASSVATLPVGEVDLLAPETRTLACQPDCELPRTRVSSGRWTVTGLRLEGTVRDGRVLPRFAGERAFQLELPAANTEAEPVAVLSGALEVPSDREHAPRVVLNLSLQVPPAIFDAVDWSQAEPSQPLNATQQARILGALSKLAPEVEVKREDR